MIRLEKRNMSSILTSIVNELTHYYYSTVFMLARIFRRAMLSLVPVSVLRSRITRKLERKSIKVTFTNEEQPDQYDKKRYQCELVVKDDRFWHFLASEGGMVFGEAYMNEWYETDDLLKLNICLVKDFKRHKEIFGDLSERVQLSKNQQTRNLAYKVIDAHYDLGNDLYMAMLDPSMNYTCAFWNEDTKTLEQAQTNKMDLIARKLKLKPGMKVLDIGCGFGGMAKYLAKNYDVSVVGYTISKQQIEYARKSCEGLDVEFRFHDYRDAKGKYDRVYSIGFFEAVGYQNFREYFEVVDRVLSDRGLHLLHSITLKDHSMTRTVRWINKYIFPGGELPYLEDYIIYSDGLAVVEDIHKFGYSYSPTLQEWYKNLVQAWPDLEAKYGAMMNGRFFRMWEFYLLFSAAAFETNILDLCQIVYSKKGVPGGYVSVR